MPRKATSECIEHRITLGDFERSELRKVVRAESIKDYGTAIQGGGVILLGAGAVVGAGALALFLAPNLFLDLKNLPTKLWNDVTGFADDKIDATFEKLDDTVDYIAKGSPVEHRRIAQEFAQRRAELSRNIAVFCTASSKHYSEQTCTKLNTQDKRRYFDYLKKFNDMIDSTYNDSSPSHLFSMKALIYKGLGDIDPTKR